MHGVASLCAVIYFFIFCGQVDVYSFGVLLCEMSVLRALIRGCLETDPQARPTMEEIINEIEPEVQGTF